MWTVPHKTTIVYFDILVYLLCLAGVYHIIFKADLPFSVENTGESLIIRNSVVYPELESLRMISINGITFSSREELEVYIDNMKIGESILIGAGSSEKAAQYRIKTIPFYSTTYLLTVVITGTLFLLIAIFVVLKSTEKKPAVLFHRVIVLTAIIMMTTWGNYNALPHPSGIILRIMFHLAYLLAPVTFLHFNWTFPQDNSSDKKYLMIVLYSAAVIIAAIQSIVFINMLSDEFRSLIPVYTRWFNIGRVLFVGCVFTSLIVFIYSFFTIRSSIERKKLKWLLLGYLIGPASFVILWVIPQAVTSEGLVPEEIMIMLMVSIPVTFAISILKYHLLDIDLILNRSFVYTIVIGCLFGIYMTLVTLLARLSGNYAQDLSIIAAISIALIFQPVKNSVQKFVDVKFFRVRYNYRQVIKKILLQISNCSNLVSLSEKIVKEINLLIPAEKSAFFLYNPNKKTLSILSHFNMEQFEKKKYFIKDDQMIFQTPLALKETVEQGIGITISDSRVFRIFDLALIIPVCSTAGEILAYFVLGKKKAGNRYSMEDVDLLLQTAAEAGITIERIYLNDKYVAEHFEKVKLEELNQLKSFFVSGVSHELKTPITSIKMFSEILNNNQKLEKEKRDEYFGIINGECNRLTRMIDNVLNIVRIEKGIKSYNFEIIDVDYIVDEAFCVLEYQLKSNKFDIKINKGPGEKLIFADRDAILEILVNLISNSIKYSHKNREISIDTYCEEGMVNIQVQDRGIGIPAEDLDSIFKPYFRSNDTEARRIAGTGLGLAIVKHVVDAHKGIIKVVSVLGEGSTFKLSFRINSNKIPEG